MRGGQLHLSLLARCKCVRVIAPKVWLGACFRVERRYKRGRASTPRHLHLLFIFTPSHGSRARSLGLPTSHSSTIMSSTTMWSGSYLDQLEQQQTLYPYDEDVDMDAEESAYVARHQEIEDVTVASLPEVSLF